MKRWWWVVCGVLCVALFAGCKGSKADNTGRFSVGENDRPTLTVESPAEGEVLETTAVTVEGAAPGLTEVAINGQPFRVVEGRFSAELEFAEGSRAVRVEGEGVTPQSVNFFVDLSPPIITLTAPAPGRFVEGFEGDQLLFRGEVFDAGAGVERVEIGGFPVQLAADGRFEATVPLNVGGNVLDVRAYDKAGREAVALRGAVYGDFTPWELPTDDSLYGHVSPETFDVVEDALLLQLQSGVVDELLNEALPTDGSFRVDDFTYGAVTIELTPQDGFILVVARVADLSIDVTFEQDLTITEINVSGGVDVDPVVLTAEIVVGIGDDGGLVASQRNVNIDLENFNLRGEGLLDFVFTLMEGFVVDLAEDALSGLIDDFVIPEIFDPELLTQSVNLLGQELVFNIILEELVVTRAGIDLVANVDMPVGPALDVPDSPGVLTTPGRPPADEAQRMLRLAVSDDFLNRILATGWRAGLININVSELVGEGGSLPIDLNVGGLSLLLGPELREQAPENTPIDVELRPLLPPVVQVQDNPDFPMEVIIADLMLDLFLSPPNGDRTLVATFNVALLLDVNASLDEGALSLDYELAVVVDLFAEPLYEMDDEKAETVIFGLFTSLPGILGPDGLDGLINLNAIDLLGVGIDGGEVKAGGSSNDYLNAEIDLGVRE